MTVGLESKWTGVDGRLKRLEGRLEEELDLVQLNYWRSGEGRPRRLEKIGSRVSDTVIVR